MQPYEKDRPGNRRTRIVVLLLVLLLGFVIGPLDAGAGHRHPEDLDKGSSLLSMEFRDADLKDVLRALGQENQLNIIVSEDVSGKVTLSFREVSFEEALGSILKVNNLVSFREGDIVRVIKSPFGEGETDLETKIIPISFADARETKEIIKELLTKKGSVSLDVRTNSLIVRDDPGNIQKIVMVVRTLDSETPQVMIEERIVEVNSNFTRELGIQWGGRLEAGSNKFFQVTGTGLTGGTGLSGSNFLVNLPATVGAGSGGAIGLLVGSIGSARQLDIQLSAMEDTGQGKILSNPRVLTLNNKKAVISSGTEILIPTAAILSTGAQTGAGGGTSVTGTGATTVVTTIDAKLELIVIPHITPDNQILLYVKTTKKDPDCSQQVQGIPPLLTRTAETHLLVGNRETIAIGGIYTRRESTAEKGGPWLSKIPIIGWFFKKQIKNEIQNELLIFITPHHP
ncbi:MAG: type IV pilus secretin PilQ [Nitrospira sp.]|nr:type IV pilus secretin PilQ [Candidatus Manganitrophaceae bacterium]HIL34383.1 type IV pilus secretin PilQ [Candidatus Manganitrophaceae bacterium]